VCLAKNHQVVDALPPDRADQSFRKAVCQGEPAEIGLSRSASRLIGRPTRESPHRARSLLGGAFADAPAQV